MRLTSTNIYHGTHVIPVKIGNHIGSDSTGLKQACPKCKADVGKINRCKECQYEPETDEILKGYNIGDEKIVFTKEQLDSIENESIIEILGSVPKDTVDIRTLTGSYCIYPDVPKKKKTTTSKILTPWATLRHALEDSDKYITVRFTNRGKERLAYLTTINGSLEMLCATFDESFSEPEEKLPDVELTTEESDIGQKFLKSLKTLNTKKIINERNAKIQAMLETGETVQIQTTNSGNEMAFFA